MDFALTTSFFPWYPPLFARNVSRGTPPCVEQNVSRGTKCFTPHRFTWNKKVEKTRFCKFGAHMFVAFCCSSFAFGCSPFSIECSPFLVSRGTFDRFNLAMFHVEHTFHLLI